MGQKIADLTEKLNFATIYENSVDYRSIPFWSWNNELDEKALTDQIVEMKNVGMGGFIIHARTGLKTEYLGEKWFSCVEACLKKAKQLNMRVWIYDENGWPSGFVGGKLLKNENFLARFLEYAVTSRFDENAFCVYIREGKKFVRIFKAQTGVEEYHCVYLRVSPSNTDILNPDVVTAFINETHEKYFDRFKDSFGKELAGFFTDEPQFYRWATPFPVKISEYFNDTFGEDVREGLIYLFVQDEEGYGFRTRYYGALSQMYLQNYFKRIYEWCESHGCKLTGHSVEEPRLYTQMWGCAGVMPVYDYEHIPGVDCLTRTGENFLSFKQVGSAAAQLGKKMVLTETFGCSGYDVTPFELCHLAEMQYFNGVDLMCQHLLPYSVAGQGKQDYPPVFYKQNNWWAEFKEFNEHFTRLGYIIANTRELYDVLVVHPMRSAYLTYIREVDGDSIKELEDSFSALLNALNERGVTYHLADETLLAKYGEVENGALRIGNCVYDKIIVPNMPSIAKTTVDLLKKFNGRLCMQTVPEYIDGERATVDIKPNTSLDEIERSSIVGFRVEEGQGAITVRTGELGDFAFIKNLSVTEKLVCSFDGKGKNYVAFDIDGAACSAVGKKIVLNARESLILTDAGEDFVAPVESKPSPQEVTKNFRVKNISENYLVSDTASFSLDGKNYSQLKPVQQIFENLLYDKFDGVIYVKHTFTVNGPIKAKLMVEKYDFLSATFNGVPLKFESSDFDINFAEADVSHLIKRGENEYVYSIHYSQRDEVYFAFFNPAATEAVRNCLHYDTYIENVYLKGDFVVEKDGSVSKPSALLEISSQMYKEGYPFFYGEVTLAGRYNYNGVGKRELSASGRFLVLNVRANGKQANLIYKNSVDITDILQVGENEIEITVKSSLRNLLGPHHFLRFKENDWVGPDTFTMYRTWLNGVSPNYDGKYNLVPFGVDKIFICEIL